MRCAFLEDCRQLRRQGGGKGRPHFGRDRPALLPHVFARRAVTPPGPQASVGMVPRGLDILLGPRLGMAPVRR
jgi:hypothetical protein